MRRSQRRKDKGDDDEEGSEDGDGVKLKVKKVLEKSNNAKVESDEGQLVGPGNANASVERKQERGAWGAFACQCVWR